MGYKGVLQVQDLQDYLFLGLAERERPVKVRVASTSRHVASSSVRNGNASLIVSGCVGVNWWLGVEFS